MLTEQEKYIILDTLNAQLLGHIYNIEPNPFAQLSAAELEAKLSILPQVRIDQLQTIAQTLATAETAANTETIAGKRRLIKADVLEWSDKPELSQVRSLGDLKSSLAMHIRLILGLPSIAFLLASIGQSHSSQARLYRG
jgi:hypothetical protein